MARRGGTGSTFGAVLVAAALLVSCNTQRWPAPMTQELDPLPPGSDSGRSGGVEDVVVVRHADPVQVRRAGAQGAFPMRFYSKRERVTAGAWVYCAAGGKAELLWPREGVSIVMFDESSVRVGERERGEPAADLMTVTRADLVVVPGVTVRLPGGAVFEGDPDRRSGPYVLARIGPEVLRLKNQGKGFATVSYRDEVLRLNPGQLVDLALLEAGTRPSSSPPQPLVVERRGIALALDGELSVEDAPGAVVVVATGDGTVTSGGVTVRLGAGERVRFAALGSTPGTAEAAAEERAVIRAAPPAPGPGATPAAPPR